MQYILTGFSHAAGFRVFAFEGIGDDRVRTEFTVRADLTLIQRYGIQMQELPLLCREILDHRPEDGTQRALTYTEADMRLNAELRASRMAEARKRKSPRKPVSENVGAAWRGSRMQAEYRR